MRISKVLAGFGLALVLVACGGGGGNPGTTSGGTPPVVTPDLGPATNLSFVSATPPTIFLDNSGGVAQALLEFKVVNAGGVALPGQAVVLTLKTQVAGTVKASIGTVGNTAAVNRTTDSLGVVSVPVFSGTVPTSVVVNAALVSNPLLQTDSSVLTVASGRAAQNRTSLSLKDFSIEGFNIDGTSTDVTLSLADRQGNPVPDGTAVNFVTEGGVMIPPVCYTGGVKDPVTGVYSEPGNSRCSVTIRSQAPRPNNGRVSIFAFVAGEEDFVDANFNNIYDAGETFTDLGNAFRDDNENALFDTGEFSVPRTGAVGTGNGCPGYLGTPNSCDGLWGAADVRRQVSVVFATSAANILGAVTTNTLSVTISDLNGNSMPTGTTVAVEALEGSASDYLSGCAITGDSQVIIPNTTAPSTFTFVYVCTNNDVLKVNVSSPSGTVTTKIFNAIGQSLICTPPQFAQNGVCVNPPPADTTPPTFPAGDPGFDQITASSFRLSALINEVGTGYYIVQNPVATCPSVSVVLLSSTTMALSANTAASKVVGSLVSGQTYNVCFVAKDAAGNPQSTVKTIGPITLP